MATKSKRSRCHLQGPVIGTIVAWDAEGLPLVDYPGNPAESVLTARATVALHAEKNLGQDVALLFVEGDPRRPLIIGLIQPPSERPDGAPIDGVPRKPLSAWVDGERLIISAEQEMVFRCGDASITLTRAGKVLIRGKYLLSRSSGVNRVSGGSVQIN